MELRPQLSVQDLRPQAFFSTKKNPAASGDVEGHMKPEFNASSTYFSIAWGLGSDKGLPLVVGGVGL